MTKFCTIFQNSPFLASSMMNHMNHITNIIIWKYSCHSIEDSSWKRPVTKCTKWNHATVRIFSHQFILTGKNTLILFVLMNSMFNLHPRIALLYCAWGSYLGSSFTAVALAVSQLFPYVSLCCFFPCVSSALIYLSVSVVWVWWPLSRLLLILKTCLPSAHHLLQYNWRRWWRWLLFPLVARLLFIVVTCPDCSSLWFVCFMFASHVSEPVGFPLYYSSSACLPTCQSNNPRSTRVCPHHRLSLLCSLQPFHLSIPYYLCKSYNKPSYPL